jgi:hypothetical protein
MCGVCVGWYLRDGMCPNDNKKQVKRLTDRHPYISTLRGVKHQREARKNRDHGLTLGLTKFRFLNSVETQMFPMIVWLRVTTEFRTWIYFTCLLLVFYSSHQHTLVYCWLHWSSLSRQTDSFFVITTVVAFTTHGITLMFRRVFTILRWPVFRSCQLRVAPTLQQNTYTFTHTPYIYIVHYVYVYVYGYG